MKKYEHDSQKTFGWSTPPTGYPGVDSLEKFHGLACKSGFAVEKSADEAMCVDVNSITFKGNVL